MGLPTEIIQWMLKSFNALKRWEESPIDSFERWQAAGDYRVCQAHIMSEMGGNHCWNEMRAEA